MKSVKFLIIFGIILGFSSKTFSQQEIDLLILNKNYEEALLQIGQQIDQNETAQLYIKKGLILNNLQNYQEAVKAFSEASRLQPGDPEILSQLAEGFSIIGNYHDATFYFEKAKKLQPDNLFLTAKLGRNYINLKKYKLAYSCFSDIYTKDSTNIYWNKQLAYSAYRNGNKNQAIYLYDKVLAQNPRDYSSYFNLIRLFDKEKDTVKILATIETGLIYFPEVAEFYNERAKYYYEVKDYESAKLDYEKYFSLGGDSLYQVLMNYGICSFFAYDEYKAISVLDICVSQLANDPIVLYYLSLSHKKINDFLLSENYMNAAIESATPAYLSEMYHHLGKIYLRRLKYKESIAALQKANELDPENSELLLEIATTYEEFNSNKTQAIKYYKLYLNEVGEKGSNAEFALERINSIKED